MEEALSLSKAYYAYQNIYNYCHQPFTNVQSVVLFNSAFFMASSIDQSQNYPGISLVNIFYTLAKQAKSNGAFKLAKSMYSFLQRFDLPRKWRNIIALDSLKIQVCATV